MNKYKYIFYFKYEYEERILNFPIEAEKDIHAIEEARSYINYRESLGFKIEKAYIEKHIESKEIVWGLENERNKI